MTANEFEKLVREMRAKQKEHMSFTFPNCLQEMLKLEKEVDRVLEEKAKEKVPF